MMDKLDREQLYNTAWKHWGALMQTDMLIEEMAELTLALLKARRNNTFYTYAVSEEMADVLICLEQFETRMRAFPHINDVAVSETNNLFVGQVLQIKDAKLFRLKERLFDSIMSGHEDVEGLENPR